jgi:hypothetical protein
MDIANLTLSTEELQLVGDSSIIFKKNTIIKKVCALFDDLSNSYLVETINKPTLGIFNPKISKGEQYQGLPYVMLDYPRLFSKDDVLAVRTFFWWGNFFSITLHLKGKYQKNSIEPLLKNFETLKENNFYVSTTSNEWEHHPVIGNFLKLKNLDSTAFETLATEHPFLKISKTFPLNLWENSIPLLQQEFMLLIKCLDLSTIHQL